MPAGPLREVDLSLHELVSWLSLEVDWRVPLVVRLSHRAGARTRQNSRRTCQHDVRTRGIPAPAAVSVALLSMCVAAKPSDRRGGASTAGARRRAAAFAGTAHTAGPQNPPGDGARCAGASQDLLRS